MGIQSLYVSTGGAKCGRRVALPENKRGAHGPRGELANGNDGGGVFCGMAGGRTRYVCMCVGVWIFGMLKEEEGSATKALRRGGVGDVGMVYYYVCAEG